MGYVQKASEAAVRKTLSYRYYIYAVITAAYFIIYFHRTSTAAMAPELVAAFGITPTAVGFIGSMYFYAYALGQLPAGILADRWGARKTLSLFVMLAGLGAIFLGQANNYGTVLAARFLVGLGSGFVFVSATRILSDWFKRNEFATYCGILTAIGNIGSLASTAPMIALMAFIGWRGAMTTVGLSSLVIAILLCLIVRNKPYEIGGASIADIENIPPVDTIPLGIGESLKILVGKYNFWTIAVMFFVLYGTIMGFQGLWGGPFLMNVYHLTNAQAGKLLTMIPIGMIGGCLMVGILADRVVKSKKKVAMVGIFGYILTWIPLVFWIDSMSLSFIRVLLLLYGIFGGTFALMSGNLQENIDLRMTGTALGVLNFCAFSGGALYQQIMAAIIARAPVGNDIIAASGFKSAFTVCLVTLVIAWIIYLTQKDVTAS